MDHQDLWAIPNTSCRKHGDTALADLRSALDETFVLLERLTDETMVQEFKMHSISPPDDRVSLAFVLAVFKHNLLPSKTTSLVKSLRSMGSDIRKCLRKLDTAFQHSMWLYTAMSNGLALVPTNGTTCSTSTTLTARIKFVDWLKDREGTWGMSKQRNDAIPVSIYCVCDLERHSRINICGMVKPASD